MVTEFSEIVNPTVFSLELTMLIMAYMISTVYVGVKMRSGLIFLFWSFTIIVLISSFAIGINFIWFWIMVILTIVIIAFVSIIKELL